MPAIPIERKLIEHCRTIALPRKEKPRHGFCKKWVGWDSNPQPTPKTVVLYRKRAAPRRCSPLVFVLILGVRADVERSPEQTFRPTPGRHCEGQSRNPAAGLASPRRSVRSHLGILADPLRQRRGQERRPVCSPSCAVPLPRRDARPLQRPHLRPRLRLRATCAWSRKIRRIPRWQLRRHQHLRPGEQRHHPPSRRMNLALRGIEADFRLGHADTLRRDLRRATTFSLPAFNDSDCSASRHRGHDS